MGRNKVTITLDVDDKGTATISKFDKNVANAFNKVKGHSNASITTSNKLSNAWNKALGGINFKAVGIAAAAMATATAYAFQKIASAATDVAKGYETALVDMGKVTDQSFKEIKAAVESIDPVLGTSTELMKGYYQVISAGVTEPKEALELLTTASKLAKTAHIEQSESIKGLTKMMAGYGDVLKTTTDAADLLFAIEKEGQTSVAELIPIIGGLSTISKETGVSANEMGAGLATLSKVFGTTAEAATSYQGILAALQRSNADMSEAWKELGVSGSKAAIKTWGFAGTLQKLKEYSKSSGVEMIKLLGRVEGTTGALAITNDGAKAFNTTMDNLKDKTGKAEEAFKRWTKTAEAYGQIWKSIKEKILVIIGDELIPILKDVVTETANWVQANEDLIKQNVHIALDKIKSSIESIVGIYNSIPDGVTGAAFGGIIGRILTGSTPVGMAIGSLMLLNTQLDKLKLGSLSNITKSFQDLNDIISATFAGESWKKWKGFQEALKTDWGDGGYFSDLSYPDYDGYFTGLVETSGEAGKETIKSIKEVGKVTKETVETVVFDWEKGIVDIEKAEKEHLKFMEGLNKEILKEDKQLLSDRMDEQDKYMTATEKETKEMLIEILDLTDDYFDVDNGKTTKVYEGFFGGLEEWLDDNVLAWEDWGEYVAGATYDAFDQINSDFKSNISDYITGELSSLSDFWDAMLNDMLSAFADWVADLLVEWAKMELFGEGGGGLLSLLGLGSGSSGSGGLGGTGILGSVVKWIGKETGLTNYLSGLFASGAGTASIGSLASTAGGTAAYHSAIGGYEGAYAVGGATTAGAGTGAASMGAWGGAGGYTGFAGGQYAATTSSSLFGGTTALSGGLYMAAAIAAMMIADELTVDTSERGWYKTQTEVWDPAWEGMSSSQRAIEMWLGVQEDALDYQEGVRYYFAKAVALGKTSAEDMEALALLHGESVEKVTKRYNLWYENTMGLVVNSSRVQEINDWYDTLSTSFGNLFDYAEAGYLGASGQVIQMALTGKLQIDVEDFFKQYANIDMSDIDWFDMSTATGGIEKYSDLWNTATENFAAKWQETLNEFTEAEQTYIANMLDAWQNGVGTRSALSESFFTMLIDDYSALTEAEQAWVATALTDYESLTTEGTEAAQAFYDANILSWEQLSAGEQEWAANMMATWTDYYDGASALAQDFYEASTGYVEYLTDANGDWIESSLTGWQALLEEATGDIANIESDMAQFNESASTGLEDLLSTFGMTLDDIGGSIVDTTTTAQSVWDSLTDSIDTWTPETKTVDIIYNYTSQGGGIPGFQHGGIASGPLSGYPVMLHGTEEIKPLGSGVSRYIDGESNRSEELAELREQNNLLRALLAKPSNTSVHIGNDQLNTHIDQRADEIRVRAEDQDAGTRRLM